jgi:hypothetical protein
LGTPNNARATAIVVLTLAEAALDADRPAGFVDDDDGVRTVGFARAAQVLYFVSRSEYSIIEHWLFRVEQCAFCIEHGALRQNSAT